MGDFPRSFIPPMSVDTFSKYACGYTAMRALNVVGNPTSNNWPAANLAIYIPMSIPFAFPVQRVFWANGATVTSNFDFGIYTDGGSRIYSTGSTAQSGASVLQYVTQTSFSLIGPGSYYFGLACSGTTTAASLNASVTAVFGRALGLLQQASAFPLPATMTPATFASVGYPLCGLSVF